MSLVLGVLASVSAGYLGSANSECDIDAIFFIRAIIASLLFALVFLLSMVAFSRYQQESKRRSLSIGNVLFNRSTPLARQTVRLAIPMTLLWLPYLLLMYPGNLSNDTTGQLAMYFALFDDSFDIALSNHHPIFDTFVFGFILKCGDHLFHNLHIALFLLIVIQFIATTSSISYALSVFHRRMSCSTHSVVVAWLFFALFPLFPITCSSLSKDTFFLWLFLLYFTSLCDVLLNGFEMSIRKAIAFSILGVLLSLTKQLGVYIFAGSAIVCIIFGKAQWAKKLKLAFPVMITCLLSFAVIPIALDYHGVSPSGKQEMLSVPLQQSALTYLRHNDDIPEDESAILEEAFAPKLSEIPELYDPLSADPIKGYDQSGRTFDGYLGLWLRQMTVYPKDYFDAWAALESPLISSTIIRPLFSTPQHSWDPGYFEEDFYSKPDITSKASEILESLYLAVSHIPIISLLFMQTTYAIVIPAIYFVTAFVVRRKQNNMLLVLSPLFFAFLGLLVSPTVRESAETMRYMLPFLYSAPLLLTLCFNRAPKTPEFGKEEMNRKAVKPTSDILPRGIQSMVRIRTSEQGAVMQQRRKLVQGYALTPPLGKGRYLVICCNEPFKERAAE